MKKILYGLLLVASFAFAQQDFPKDIEYCWTLPTKYTDGSDIQPGDLANIRIFTQRQSGETVIDQLVSVGTLLPGDNQCHTFVGVIPQPGTYTAVAFAITVDGISSDPSGTATKKFTGKPNPPSSFSNN